MKLCSLIFAFILLPVLVWAQSAAIAGKIISSDRHQALGDVSVFLSNSSFGTATASDGTFTLRDVRSGQYTLVVVALGYENYTQTVLVNNTDVKLDIALKPRPVQLQEVKISSVSKVDFRIYIELFQQEFIGNDDNASLCKIINPEVLNFKYKKADNLLTANTTTPLIIENRALGYRIKYLIDNFSRDGKSGIVDYTGSPLFEEMTGKPSQLKKWQKARDQAYYGSAMHFYRSLLKNSLANDGFEVYHLTQQLRPKGDSHPASLPSNWHVTTEIKLGSIYYNEVLNKTKLQPADILRTANVSGLYAITFPDYLYVVYTKRKEKGFFKDVYHPAWIPNYEVSIASLSNKPPRALFDKNGTMLSNSILYDGTWSKARLSELLPVDYVPVDKF